MTLKIERISGIHGTRIRLSGALRCGQLTEVRNEIERESEQVTLDLDELELVDIQAVRFLNSCEANDVKLVNCAHYIREWMLQEQANERD